MMRHQRNPEVVSKYTWPTKILAGLAVLSLGALFWAQQDRIGKANERFDELFHQYSLLSQDCRDAEDCYTDVQTPAEIIEGQPGTPGLNGSPGSQGIAGDEGEKGDKGEKGDMGVPGQTGPVGPAGEPGANGTNGEPGPAGATGPEGAQGPTGATGPQGPAGVNAPVIVQINCQRQGDGLTGTWVFVFDNGTSIPTDGMCTPSLESGGNAGE